MLIAIFDYALNIFDYAASCFKRNHKIIQYLFDFIYNKLVD